MALAHLALPGRLANSFQSTFPWVVGCIDGVLEPDTVFLISCLVAHLGGEVLQFYLISEVRHFASRPKR